MIGNRMPTGPMPIGLDERRDAAGEKVGIDQQRDLIFRQMQRAAENQRHGDGVRIHDEHVLEAQSGQLRQRQHLIDGVNGRAA